jgi:hypothetical protein
MKQYSKSWNCRVEAEPTNTWARLSNPMSLKVNEDKKSAIFIAASLEFSRSAKEKELRGHKGSLYYKIEVNGVPLIQYHVPNPRGTNKAVGVNLHGETKIPAGENTIEVFYKMSKNGSWDLMQNQSQRQLSVMAFPTE